MAPEPTEKVRNDLEALHAAWLRLPGRICTRARMRKLMGRWSHFRMKTTIAILVASGKLQEVTIQVPAGLAYTRKATGYRAVAAAGEAVSE